MQVILQHFLTYSIAVSQCIMTTCLICCCSSFVLPKQCRPTEGWTPQDPQRCPVEFGTKALAADASSLFGCEVDQTCWSSTDAQLDWVLEVSDFELLIFKPFLNHVCSVAGCITLLKEATFTKGYHYHDGLYLVCLGWLHVSNLHPH